MDTTAVTGANTGAAATKKASEGSALATTDFDSFLTLLTAQLRNQDPLNPQDSTQWVAQLATFSSVEQQIKTNSLLEGIATGLGGGDLLEGASRWVGLNVEAATDSFAYGGDDVSLIVPQGEKGVSRDVVLRNATGEEVLRRPVGSARGEFVWDGRDNTGLVAPQGVYSARVESTDAEGNVRAERLDTQARVEEARLSDGAVQLLLSNGSVTAPDSIRAVTSPRS